MRRQTMLFAVLLLCIVCLPYAQAQSGYAWVQSIGRPGGGGNLLTDLGGVVLDASGNICVTDQNYSTVSVLDPQGNFLFAFGGNAPGGYRGAPGTFYAVGGIARDTAGNFYVADIYNNRIQKFDSRGRFLLQFGKNGSRTGQFTNPQGVAVDSAGNIYVADTGNNRIQKFNAKGVPLLKIGASGSGNGLLNTPVGVRLDGTGNIYVADAGNHRIQKFGPTGTYLLQFGSNGSNNGQFSTITDVALDGAGNIYVADYSNSNVQKFSAAGAYLAMTPINRVQGINFDSAGALYAVNNQGTITVITPATMAVKYSIYALTPNFLAIDSSNNTYVTDRNGRLLKFDPSGKVVLNFAIPASGSRGTLGVAVDSKGSIYIADYDNSKVLKYASTGGTPTTIATSGSANGQVNGPSGLALDATGNLYVADYNNGRIEKFSATGTFLAAYNAASQLNGPVGVAVDSSGNIYVADWNNNNVRKLSSAGKSLLTIGSNGSGNGQFSNPSDVAVDSASNIYVTDYGNSRIQKFNSAGAFVAVFPTSVSNPQGIRLDNSGNLVIADHGDGIVIRVDTSGNVLGGFDGNGPNAISLDHPLGIRLDSNNHLYVTSHRWAEKLTTTGNWLGSFGAFRSAAGLALDSAGNIYVADQDSSNVQKFTNKLLFQGTLGSPGSANGQFSGPNGVALDNAGNLYVTDSGNYRVQKFNTALVYAGQFGARGTGDGQFLQPSGITITGAGDILVADYDTNASWVNLFGLTAGNPFLGSFGTYGSGFGLFANPFDVNQDSIGNIYVADEGNARVQIFDNNANFLYSISGQFGAGSGQFIYPDSVAVDPGGNVYIVDSYTARISVFAPIPLLATLSPTTTAAGSATLSLAVTGSGFTPDAAISFNGVPLTTKFLSNTSLTATLPATQIANAGVFPVNVVQAGGASNPIPFTVTGATIPTVTTLTPASATAGVASVALTVTGTNFLSSALIKFGNTNLPTVFVSSTQLKATVPGALLAAVGVVPVAVSQSGATSNTVNFTINSAGAPPVIAALNPPAADQGSPTLTLTLNGTGFTADAVVKFNGIALTTTFVSSTQLTATLLASLMTTAAHFPVIVSQASGISNTVGFAVNPPSPMVTSFSPLSARVGSPAISVVVNGSNFTSDAVVSFNNTNLTTTFVSATQVVAKVPASLLAQVGVYPVLLTQASGSSDPVYFAVNALPPVVTTLNPTSVTAGSAATTLTVTGSGFTSDAVVLFNGVTLTTTFTSSTQLTATVPASLLTKSGYYPVAVKQMSGSSKNVSFVVN